VTENDAMPDDPKPDREPPDDVAGDPADADLIAFLDGELAGPDAARVEDKLALDPTARAKAEAYKKTYDLLDYLPRPEPSPDFATRTLTKLQPALSGSGLGATAGYAGSGEVVPLTPRRSRVGVLAWVAAAVVAVAGGFGAHAGLRPYVDPPRPGEELLFSDHRVIERLPLYVAVDDLEFLKQLDDPDLFAPEPATAPAAPRPGSADAPPANREELTALFKSFPTARQQQLRTLDQQFHDLPLPERDHLGRVLETYAVWADRLADADRRELLSAPTPAARLDAVRRLREKTWRDALPAKTKDLLKRTQSSEERLEYVEKLRADERARAEEWAIARRQWDTLHHPEKKPWPFSDPRLADEVTEYVRTVFKADLARTEPKDFPISCRLTRDEFLELKARHDAATKDGNWFWYGLYLHRLAGLHPYLPEPAQKPMIADVSGLPPGVNKKAVLPLDRRNTRGKWPEFVLEVADGLRRTGHPVPESLGPCRPEEFKPPVQQFLAESLFPKLTPADKEALKKLEGKFPDYPRQVVEVATRYDESIPGVMLPGKPTLWARNYSLPSQPRKKK
jgi:hypothetical protein